MLKSITLACVSVLLLSSSSLEAQILRRLIGLRNSMPPAGNYAPPQGNTYAPSGVNQTPQQRYYRRVEVAPGRFALVPAQPIGASQEPASSQQAASSPQDIARKNSLSERGNQQPTLSLEGPRSSSSANIQVKAIPAQSVQAQPAPTNTVQSQTPRQMYRRVTVYNSRTGQRSVRLIPIPSSSLAQQPYLYGQNRVGQNPIATNIVNGTLRPPVQSSNVATASNVTAATNSVRVDSQVTQATFDDAPIRLDQPNVASATPTVIPEPQPAIVTTAVEPTVSLDDMAGDTKREYSVLDYGDGELSAATEEGGLELAAPAN